MRQRLLLLLLWIAFLGGCGQQEVKEIRGRVESRNAVASTSGVSLSRRRLAVYGQDARRPLAEGKIRFDLRWKVPRSGLELRNLPERWEKVVIALGPDQAITLLERGQSLPPIPPPEPAGSWVTRHLSLTIFFALVTFYVVAMIGVTGGPNHGEHPFLVNMLHLFTFGVAGGAWARPWFYPYLALLGAALVLSVLVIPIREYTDVVLTWLARAVMFGLYIGLFVILVRSPEYVSDARWIGPSSIQLYVPRSQRHRVLLLDEAGRKLAEDTLYPGIDYRILYFWTAPSTPKMVRLLTPDGVQVDLKLGDRPRAD